MNVQHYFERIDYKGPTAQTVEVLSQLQLVHLLTVPFENLDIGNHVKIDLDNLYDKIVIRRRGGFCYELNGLFYQLLKEIGFDVIIISARVYNEKTKNYSPEYDHMALIVSISNAHYLVDVGFGEFALSPININPGTVTDDSKGIFKIDFFRENYKIVQKENEEGGWTPEYIFTESRRSVDEFYERCLYHQTSPESHFTQKRICSLPTPAGRISLTDNTLKITTKGVITEEELHDEKQVQQVLWNYFGIKFSTQNRSR